jgi:hypothetical protein
MAPSEPNDLGLLKALWKTLIFILKRLKWCDLAGFWRGLKELSLVEDDVT